MYQYFFTACATYDYHNTNLNYQIEYFNENKIVFQKNAPVLAGGGSAPCSLLHPGGTVGAHDKRVSC